MQGRAVKLSDFMAFLSNFSACRISWIWFFEGMKPVITCPSVSAEIEVFRKCFFDLSGSFREIMSALTVYKAG
jgi:hypothetical protein